MLTQRKFFRDRKDAGQQLASALKAYAGRDDVLVLALPRGGVPVAYEVSRALSAPLDLMLVRKLGTPGQPELAMGAIASGGVRVLNPDVMAIRRVSDETLEAAVRHEQAELERRERTYRGDRPPLNVAGKQVILVDDGIATGATMRAAVQALRQMQPAAVIVAIPTGARETCRRLERESDQLICLDMPEPYYAVGMSYQVFDQTSDAEVTTLLKTSAEPVQQGTER